MDRLSVLCFAGTYLLALASDLARVALRSRGRWSLTVGLTALGWAVHTAYLANLMHGRGELPVTTIRDSLLVLAWILAAIDVYLILRSPRPVAAGLFILPVVVALSAFAALAGHRVSWVSWGGPVRFWIDVHIAFQVLGAGATCVAFVAGLMFLAQSARLKRKRPPRSGLPLPSLEQSERLHRGAITVAFPFLSFGLLLGAVLIVATRRGGVSVLAWSDPKILSSVALWCAVLAVLLNARFRPAMRGRRVMLLTVLAFGVLLFAWVGVGLLVPTAHGTAPAPAGTRGLP
jgi:ABC-type uncharacterized transport system permease subunit